MREPKRPKTVPHRAFLFSLMLAQDLCVESSHKRRVLHLTPDPAEVFTMLVVASSTHQMRFLIVKLQTNLGD